MFEQTRNLWRNFDDFVGATFGFRYTFSIVIVSQIPLRTEATPNTFDVLRQMRYLFAASRIVASDWRRWAAHLQNGQEKRRKRNPRFVSPMFDGLHLHFMHHYRKENKYTYINFFSAVALSNRALNGWNTFRLVAHETCFAEASLHAIILVAFIFRNRNARRRCNRVFTAWDAFTAALLIHFVFGIVTNAGRWRSMFGLFMRRAMVRRMV